MTEKTLYSKRFPNTFAEFMEEDEQNQLLGDESGMLKDGKTFLEEIETEENFEVIPEKMAASKLFIDMAIQLCECYEIDFDIIQTMFGINFRSYHKAQIINGFMKTQLTQLMVMCDDVHIWFHGLEPGYDYGMDIFFATHDFAFIGR